MVKAYVLIQTDVGKSRAVSAAISTIDGVIAVDSVTGPYDIIARIEAAGFEEVGNLVIAQIQEVAGIGRTLTCTVIPD